MLGRDFPFTGFSALVTSEHSSSGSQLTILLSQASVKHCFFFSFIFVLGNEIFLYTVCLKYPYKNINGKVVAPKIQKNLTTSCCIAKVASQVFFFFLALSQRTSFRLAPLANTHLSHARNKFDNTNLISTWLPSPPHI